LKLVARKVAPLDLRRVQPPVKEADPFYLSDEWRAFVDYIFDQRGRRCEDPRHDDALPRFGPAVRVIPDHIVELKDGGAKLAPNNIMLRCWSCHQRKTNRERARRAATA